MKSLLKFASAAIGVAAFGFLVWESDQAPLEPLVDPDKAVAHPGGAPSIGSYQVPPGKNAAAPGSHAKSSSSGKSATVSPVAVGPGTPPVAASVDSNPASRRANAPASSRKKNSPPVAAGPAGVDLPMDWGQPVREISIPVPAGEMIPAVFHDDAPKPPAQMRALDRIAAEFEQNVGEIPPGMTQNEVWRSAREIADERYLTLFGYEAFNQFHLRGAREALREKKAGQNSKLPQPTP